MRDLHLSGTGKFSSHPSASCPSRKGNEGSFYHPSLSTEIKLDLSIEDNKSLLSQYWGSASLCHILPLFCSEVPTVLKFFIQKLEIWQCKPFLSPVLKTKENIYIYMLLEKKMMYEWNPSSNCLVLLLMIKRAREGKPVQTFCVGHLATKYWAQHQFSPGTKVQELKKEHIEKDPFKIGAAWIKIVTICSSDERGKGIFYPLCLFFRLRLGCEMSPSRKGKTHIWGSFLYNTGFLLVAMAGTFGLYFVWEFQRLVLTLTAQAHKCSLCLAK